MTSLIEPEKAMPLLPASCPDRQLKLPDCANWHTGTLKRYGEDYEVS